MKRVDGDLKRLFLKTFKELRDAGLQPCAIFLAVKSDDQKTLEENIKTLSGKVTEIISKETVGERREELKKIIDKNSNVPVKNIEPGRSL